MFQHLGSFNVGNMNTMSITKTPVAHRALCPQRGQMERAHSSLSLNLSDDDAQRSLHVTR